MALLINLNFPFCKTFVFERSLLGSVVIGAEFCWEDYGLIPRNCDREEAETT
jgi:hypothetical protein